MLRLGPLLLFVIPLGCAAVDPVQRDAMAELLNDDASYYEVRFEGEKAGWLTGDAMVLALREGEVELVTGSMDTFRLQLVGEAERTPSKLGPTYRIGLVGTDRHGAPVALRLTALLEPRGDLRGTGVLDSNGRVTNVTFSARPTTAPAAEAPCSDETGATRYHLPDGVHTGRRPRTPCADQRTSSTDSR